MRSLHIAALLRWLAACCLTLPAAVFAADAQQTLPVDASSKAQAEPTAPAKRPKVALVLSGGGARGFAHIGVLRALRDMQVPVDMVVGTSMGSVIGGAYAAGSSVQELEKMVRTTDWERVLADRPARTDLTFRRKEEDIILPSRIEFGVSLSGAALPPSAAGNGALEAALAQLLPEGMRDQPANKLALPFRCVASDLLTGDLVELADTPLFLAMRASLALPGVFAPVRVNQRLVVDGGLVRNLPVDLARAMGADVVIAVNVGTPLAGEDTLGSALGVAQQMLAILTEQNVKRSLQELKPTDILISPDLNGISFLDFSQHDKAMQAGAKAAQALAARLRALAVPQQEYAVLEDQRLAMPVPAGRPLPLAKLTVESQGPAQIRPETLLAQSGLRVGDTVTPEQVRQAAVRLYGRGDLERVETEVQDDDGQRSVVIKPTEAPWARRRLRLGLQLSSDFSDSNNFTIGFMHVASSLNDWGAELRTAGSVGTQRSLGVQLWQPLGAGSFWYAQPSIQYGASSTDLFEQGRRLYRISDRALGTSFVLGRQFGNWGDLQVGVTRQSTDVGLLIPEDPNKVIPRQYQTNQFVQFRVDTLDSVAFPSSGQLLTAQLGRSPSSLPDGSTLASTSLLGLTAFHFGDWAGHVYGEWSKADQGNAPLSLGGFLRLSGTTPDSLQGRTEMLGRLVMARRIGDLPTALGGPVRAGFSAELGGVFGQDQPVRLGDMKQAASAFFSVDTRFGPLYLGAGSTRGTGSTLYLFLGPIW
jgi:NTE family protein